MVHSCLLTGSQSPAGAEIAAPGSSNGDRPSKIAWGAFGAHATEKRRETFGKRGYPFPLVTAEESADAQVSASTRKVRQHIRAGTGTGRRSVSGAQRRRAGAAAAGSGTGSTGSVG